MLPRRHVRVQVKKKPVASRRKSQLGGGTKAALAEFRRQGFVVFQGALAAKLPCYLDIGRRLVERAGNMELRADWNSGGFVHRANAEQFPPEKRLLKVQSAALEDPALLDIFRDKEILRLARAILTDRGVRGKTEVDVFG